MKNTSFMITRLKNPQFSEKICVSIEIAFRDEIAGPRERKLSPRI